MASTIDGEVPLRIVLVASPPGVQWAVQLGRADLLAPSLVESGSVTFDFAVRIDPKRTDLRRFTGPPVQGRTGEQFVYVNSGKRAAQTDSCWDRRAKVSLMTIPPKLLDELRRSGGRLECRIAGTARDGGPACASVPLLDGGWQLLGGNSG